MATLSSHVPDPRLLTAHAERETGPLHRVNPWTKVGALPVLVAAVTVARSLPAVGIVYAAALTAFVAAGLPVGRLVRWYALPVTLVGTIAVPLAFGAPGDPILAAGTPLGRISLTRPGVELAATYFLRAFAVATYSLAVLGTTRYVEVSHVLGRTLPSPIDQIALLAYRFTFVMIETLEEFVAAARSRGGRLSDFRSNWRLYGRLLGATFLRAVERSERLVAAMESRGYRGDLTRFARVERPPVSELLALAALTAVVLGYAATVTYGVVG